MKTMRSVVLAPRYANSELRSRRTIEAAKEVFGTVDVFWNGMHPGNRREQEDTDEDVRERFVKRLSLWHLRSLVGLPALDSAIAEAIRGADLVYVHDGGVEGLLLAKSARRLNPNCAIVFDYHDSIRFELFYQLKKRRLESLFHVLWSVYRLPLPTLARSIDAVVGISANQIEDFFLITGRTVDAAIVPNFREFTQGPESPQLPSDRDEVSLVWIGQVMRGRDLEFVANWTQGLGRGVALHVFGRVLDEEAETAVRSTLGDHVCFHGDYQSDDDIRMSLPRKPVGVFLGWADPANTRINEIASPNKFYSYVNLELPLILGASLIGLVGESVQHGAGLAVDSYSDFVSAVDRIRENYPLYVSGTRLLKTEYRARNLRSDLDDLLRRVSRTKHNQRNRQQPT